MTGWMVKWLSCSMNKLHETANSVLMINFSCFTSWPSCVMKKIIPGCYYYCRYLPTIIYLYCWYIFRVVGRYFSSTACFCLLRPGHHNIAVANGFLPKEACTRHLVLYYFLGLRPLFPFSHWALQSSQYQESKIDEPINIANIFQKTLV